MIRETFKTANLKNYKKMKKGLITYSIFAAMTAFAVMSCADDAEQYIDGGADGVFRLASDQEAFTRAAESTGTTFKEGTSYQLYAIEGTNFSMNYLKDPAGSGAVEGTETDNHTIGGELANKFNNRTLNFYGVTNSTEHPVRIIEKNGIPTSYIAYEANKPLTDVMWAKKENQTNKNSGTITLPFGHTLSKLNLYVLKGADYKDTPILKAIRLMDYAEGNLSMATGQYESQANDQRNYWVSVLSGANQTVTTTAELVTSAGQAVAPMIFPTRRKGTNDIKNHALQVEVTVTVKGKETKQTTQITSLLAEDPQAPEVPFNFESNHEYDMVITVTEKSLVVTIVPRVYDWIPVEEVKPDPDVNGSMTIGGITWMDRNVGASSGNPLASEQDWENSRGYFYQYGRNIPYYIKTYTDKQGITSVYSQGKVKYDGNNLDTRPFPFIPNHETDKPLATNKSYRWYGQTPSLWIDASDYSLDKVSINPIDNKRYNYYFYYYDDWYNGGDWDTNQKTSETGWNSPDKQPCPKGWRIPTADEYLLIFPVNESMGDISFARKEHENLNYYTGTIENEIGNASTDYVIVRKGYNEGTVGKTGTIYALKKKGAPDAYYLRWHIEQAGSKSIDNPGDGDLYRNVLVISRYPATEKDILTETNVFTKDWRNPVEILKFPIGGYIHATSFGAGLIYSGSEVVYWTSSTNSIFSYSVRIKFAGDKGSNSIYINNEEYRHNGALIRCVRDTQAN